MRRGEEGKLSGFLSAAARFLLPSELGLAKGLVGGLGELDGELTPITMVECASMGATRLPAEEGEARRDTSSTCRNDGSSG